MENTIRNYRNTIQLTFKRKDGVMFNTVRKLPNYGNWVTVIRFLKSRGWTIKENPHYKEQYACLSPFHKIGFKGNLALLMEISGTSMSINFGHVKNLWQPPQFFWDNPSDDRYLKLTYLENASVKLEVKRLMEFGASKFRLKDTSENPNPSPEEYIINKCNNNTHIHGKVTCLNDIKLAITESSYDYTVNSNDKNGKKIICGETKYFYNNRTLEYGVAWHNINNMWWVISGGKLRNISSGNLFDFDSRLPRKKPVSKERIESLLKNLSFKKEFLKCHKILSNKKNAGIIEMEPA